MGAWREIPADSWHAVMEAHGVRDAYVQRGWLDASCALEVPGSASVLIEVPRADGTVHGSALIALIVRPIADTDRFDAITAYGYGGPVCVGSNPPDPNEIARSLDEWAASRRVVASFLRFHPILDTMRWAPAGASVHAGAGTVGWRLNPAVDLLEGMHKHHRRAVRKADREGVEITVRDVDGVDDLAAFRTMYDVTMRRQNADDFYFFPDAYWQRLAADAGGRLIAVSASREADGGDIAGLLVVDDGVNLHYHLGASLDAARSVGASNRCFLAAAQHGQALCRGMLHLGGGVGGGNDSLLEFKHRFDPESRLLPFGVAKIVHDAHAYAELAGTTSIEGYFPPWRAPVAAGGV